MISFLFYSLFCFKIEYKTTSSSQLLEHGFEILRNLSNERKGNETKDDDDDQQNEFQHEELKYWTSS